MRSNKSVQSVYGVGCEGILWCRKFKAGYYLQRELVGLGAEQTPMTVAYNHNGDYIGDSRSAYYLCVKRGIMPELRKKTSKTCSIGYSFKHKKWFGWSHRAIYGFKVGSKIKKGDCGYNSRKGAWTAKTMLDARRMAMNFAEGVS